MPVKDEAFFKAIEVMGGLCYKTAAQRQAVAMYSNESNVENIYKMYEYIMIDKGCNRSLISAGDRPVGAILEFKVQSSRCRVEGFEFIVDCPKSECLEFRGAA